MPAFSIEQQVTFLYTRNLQQTDHFYRNMLGLPLVLDQGPCRIYRVCGDAFIGFCNKETAPNSATHPGSAHVIFTLVTNQVDEWYAHLQRQGITIEKPPTYNAAYNIYHCFLRDPNGYLIEIQTFFDPAWPVSNSRV